MRRRFSVRVGLIFALVATVWLSRATADEPKLTGKWGLAALTVSDEPLLIVKIDQNDDKPSAEVLSSQSFLAGAKIPDITISGDTIGFDVVGNAGKNTFVGNLPKDGGAEQPILGTFRLQGNPYPARLNRTEADEVGQLARSPVQMQVLLGLRGVNEPREKIEKLRAIVAEHEGHPALAQAFTEMLRSAEAAGLSDQEVRDIAKQWQAVAAPYGADWAADTDTKLLAALAKQDKYAAFRLELAEAVAKSLGNDAPLEQQAAVARAISESATAAGKADIAAAARDRWQALEGQLDEQYHKTVPPFQVSAFGGRKDPAQDRVVLLELFTGAQCPPCVAADVAFDAALKTYRSTELIGLQYHLHIPGPDPLTNLDSLARAQYYDVHGTPSTYFNGKSEAGGGGPMAASEGKYDAYVELINQALAGKRGASIDLKVTRSGNVAQVEVAAKITPAAAADSKPADAAKVDDAKAGDENKEEGADEPKSPQPRLRLVLVQEAVRYVGGNKLRFHHHVVRGMPGGVEGKDFVDGASTLSLAVDLEDIRGGLEQYVKDFAEKREFPQTPPAVETTGLSIVALVQDDATKEVLDAVLVAVPEAP